MMKQRRSAGLFIAATWIALLPMMGFAKTKPIMTTDLLQHLKKGEPWDRSVFTATKMATFQKTAGDATTISKITLAYFTSSDCTGSKAGSGFYTTDSGTSFMISVGTAFGLVAASAWNVGAIKLSIADMTAIHSIAVTFKSTDNNTPQAAFTNGSGQVISYACMLVTCASGECISGSGTQSFTLKTMAAVGDPADGGVIGCQNTGTSFNLFDIVVTTSNQMTSQRWGNTGVTTGATSTTDGAANTATIVAIQGTGTAYAARTCSGLSVTGGFTSGWFLPSAGATNSQLNCLYNNQTAIATGSTAAGGAGFSGISYWSSTEVNSNEAWRLNFLNGDQVASTKTGSRGVRCSRAF